MVTGRRKLGLTVPANDPSHKCIVLLIARAATRDCPQDAKVQPDRHRVGHDERIRDAPDLLDGIERGRVDFSQRD
jgi:hypothetical protein